MTILEPEEDDERRRRAHDERHRSRRELRMFVRRLFVLLAALVALILLGALALSLTGHVSFGFGIVWTLDTVTTLGTVHLPSTNAPRVVLVVLEVFGIGTLFYGLATVAEFFVSGQLSGLLDERRSQRMIDSYTDHVIVCGFGRVGRQVSRDLDHSRIPHVAIDAEPLNREPAEAMGVRFIESYAADDDVLIEAGIRRARAIVACVDSDADNIVITLTARELAPDILIVARASADGSEKKLVRAGADRVISPYKTSGSEMARAALHPQVAGAVQVADHRMEEIEVPDGCPAIGRSLAEISGETAIVALRHADGRLEAQPSPQSAVDAGDLLIAIGRPMELDDLERYFAPAPGRARTQEAAGR